MNKISRRQFLYAGATTAAGVALSACQPKTVIVKETVQVEKEVTKVVEVEKEVTKVVEVEKEVTKVVEVEKLITPTALPSNFNESPVTAAMVAEGKLPSVDERLPSEPLVVFPYDEIGQYGGQLRAGSLSTSFYGGDPSLYMAHQSFLRLTPNLREAVPNIFKDWQVSSDFTEITCFMRKGMKWSDGEPCTVDAFMWWWEDHTLNTDITPTIGQWFRVGGKPMEVTRVDDYTVKMKFAAPNPSFVLVNLAHRYGFWSDNLLPGHYLREFHAKYNPKAQALAEEAGFDFWYQYYGNRRNVNQNIEVPKLRSHLVVDESPERVLFTRNPYFFIADSEGNQLPYIDEAIHDRVADLSLLNAKIVGGSYDFAGFDTNIQNYSTYNDAADQGNYKILLWRSGKGSDVVYQVNANWGEDRDKDPDPVKDMQREIFRDIRFRKALSYAINRDEVNEVLYFGHGTPRQMTVIPDSRHFKDKYATAFAEYDPDKANALLDELGLAWNADKSRRTWPDGSDLIIAWDLYESETPKGPTTELMKEYWLAVGIDIQYKSVTRDLLRQKVLANEEPMSLWHGDETTDVLFCRRPKFFVPLDGDESCWGVLWGRWYNTDGQSEQGVEPPDYIKDLYIWLDKYIETDGDEWAAKILESQAENVWVVGVVGNAPHPLIFNKDLGNLTQDGYWVWDSLWTWPNYPCQWYFKS